MVLRDSQGCIKWAWVNRFESENTFCAEVEATTQALNIATNLNLQEITIEGDVFNVIIALHGLNEYVDWRASSLITVGRRQLNRNCLWKISYALRECNESAYYLAK